MKRSREPDEEEETGPATPHGDSAFVHSAGGSPPAPKAVELDPLTEDGLPPAPTAMRCSLPPHRESLPFKSYEEFESHYSKAHANRCVECGRVFPSTHLLDLHHEECHDAFVALKRENGEHTYSCFVEGCERKCMTPQKRRLHLIDKHMYPKNYFFLVTRDGVEGRRSMLLEGGHRRRRSSIATKDSRRESIADVGTGGQPVPARTSAEKSSRNGREKGSPDEEMDELTGAMSALQFVPMSVRFGRGGGKAGFRKR